MIAKFTSVSEHCFVIALYFSFINIRTTFKYLVHIFFHVEKLREQFCRNIAEMGTHVQQSISLLPRTLAGYEATWPHAQSVTLVTHIDITVVSR